MPQIAVAKIQKDLKIDERNLKKLLNSLISHILPFLL
jgi:hypothetical protein